MKLLIISAFACVSATAAYAQNSWPSLPREGYGMKKYDLLLQTPALPRTTPVQPSVKLLEPASVVRDGVEYPLKFGNMPCVVPETSAIAPIPNAFNSVNRPLLEAIPNPLMLYRSEVIDITPVK